MKSYAFILSLILLFLSSSFIQNDEKSSKGHWTKEDKKLARNSLAEGGIKKRKVQNCIIYKLEQIYEDFEDADKQEGAGKENRLVKLMQDCILLHENKKSSSKPSGKSKKTSFKPRKKNKSYHWSKEDIKSARESLRSGGILDKEVQDCIIDKLQKHFKSFSEADSNAGGEEKEEFLVNLMVECLN